MLKKKNARRILFVLIGIFGCFILFRCTNTVRSESNASFDISPTPTFYQVKFKVVLVGEVFEEDNVFYVDLEVLEDPRKYLRPGEVMPFELPKQDHFKYKKLQGSVVYLWCEEFFFVDIKCNIYDYIKEE